MKVSLWDLKCAHILFIQPRFDPSSNSLVALHHLVCFEGEETRRSLVPATEEPT
jgi:uncharacterized protein with von Willebrand factor type A (vWA) domain